VHISRRRDSWELLPPRRAGLHRRRRHDALSPSLEREPVELLNTIPTISKISFRLLSKRLAKVRGNSGFGTRGPTIASRRSAPAVRRAWPESPKGTVIPLALTHEDLANLIGTTRENGHDPDEPVPAHGAREAARDRSHRLTSLDSRIRRSDLCEMRCRARARGSPVHVPIADSCRDRGVSLEHILAPSDARPPFLFSFESDWTEYGMIRFWLLPKYSFLCELSQRPSPSLVFRCRRRGGGAPWKAS